MPNLQKFNAKVCYTAAGLLIHDEKVLFIKHKKLKMWFAPGGHVDKNELPHQTAEREFWEETGIKVKAIDAYGPKKENKHSERLPTPLLVDLHWVSEENFQNRTKSKNPDEQVKTDLWPKGCEQHLGFVYLVKPEGSLDFKENTEEVDGIAWFTLEEVLELEETTQDIKDEVLLAFDQIS